jgi:hypothetical protein
LWLCLLDVVAAHLDVMVGLYHGSNKLRALMIANAHLSDALVGIETGSAQACWK